MHFKWCSEVDAEKSARSDLKVGSSKTAMGGDGSASEGWKKIYDW